MKKIKLILAIMLVVAMSITLFAACADEVVTPPPDSPSPGQPTPNLPPPVTPDPTVVRDKISFSMTYSDNVTLPFKLDWTSVGTAAELFNVDITWEVYPIADYSTTVIAELQTGTDIDVILYVTPTTGDLASLALGGAIVPISDYVEMGWTPHFSARIAEWDLQGSLNDLRLSDGKHYSLPRVFDAPFYDGGLILREDLLTKFNMQPPKTFDDLYEYLKACKEDNPDSYPLTILVGPRVHYRFTQPSWGVSVGINAATGTHVLSWDYTKKEFFAGAISEQYKSYLEFHAKLYAEGLFDPEFYPEGDMWMNKMATGAATATYAYYDQIGGVHGNSNIPGIQLNLFPPLIGTNGYGAHTQPRNRLGPGIVFSAAAAQRDDFEELVRRVDEMFFSPAGAQLWWGGVEGLTFTMNNGQYEFYEDARNSPDGIYKYLQVAHGLGADPLQHVWVNALEMLKYDENYARINGIVENMSGAIPYIPGAPLFNEADADRAGLFRAAMADAFNVWAEDFITGAKSLDTDWDDYVAEMTTLGINDMLALFNANKR